MGSDVDDATEWERLARDIDTAFDGRAGGAWVRVAAACFPIHAGDAAVRPLAGGGLAALHRSGSQPGDAEDPGAIARHAQHLVKLGRRMGDAFGAGVLTGAVARGVAGCLLVAARRADADALCADAEGEVVARSRPCETEAAKGQPIDVLLARVNAVLGVVGSMLCDRGGRVMFERFPQAFGAAATAAMARVLEEHTGPLAMATGYIDGVQLRFRDARVLMIPLPGAWLVLLCSASGSLVGVASVLVAVLPSLDRLLIPQREGPGASARADGTSAESAGSLQEAVRRIDAVIERKGLDAFRVRGAIAMKAGFALCAIGAGTRDDGRLERLKEAAASVLGEPLWRPAVSGRR